MSHNNTFGEELTSCFKIDMMNVMNFDSSTQNLNFNELFLIKIYNIWARKVQRSYVSENWRLMQNLKETNLCFQIWPEEFSNFSPKYSKVSKLGLWWDCFIRSRKCMSFKFTKNPYVTTMKNNAKFGEKLTFHFKIDIINLVNFDPSTEKS